MAARHFAKLIQNQLRSVKFVASAFPLGYGGTVKTNREPGEKASCDVLARLETMAEIEASMTLFALPRIPPEDAQRMIRPSLTSYTLPFAVTSRLGLHTMI
jgi:hypothetical protein